jgi:hypothetical protein
LPQVAAAAEALAIHTSKVCASRKTSEPGSGGQEGEEPLSWAQVQADTAITWLSGSLPAAPPPVTVNLVMTPTQLLGADASPVRVPGYGHIPATLARAMITPRHDQQSPSSDDTDGCALGDLHEGGCALGDPDAGRRDETGDRRQREGQGEGSAGDDSSADVTVSAWDEILAPLLTAPFPGCEPPADAAVFLRRLFTSPDGQDLASMESTARLFPPHLRQFFVLRDDRDRHPYSDAPIRHADHVTSHSEGGPTSVRNGQGLSVRANHVKTLPGWKAKTLTEDEVTAYATSTDATDPSGRIARLAGPHTHVVEVTTPTGHTYLSAPRPLTG